MSFEEFGRIKFYTGDLLDHYASWDRPTVIVSDGPYGVSGYPGDPSGPEALPAAYAPHIEAWTKAALPETTLWFWCTEVGWAMVHPLLVANGWQYRACNVWDKGLGHVAGNCNGKTMKTFPVVTEVCVHYTRKTVIDGIDVKTWLRSEWERTGLPFSKSNEACGVKSAATRKYFTKDDLFYPPPPDVFAKIRAYANAHGNEDGKPYFGPDDDAETWWRSQFPKFNFEYGVSNVWAQPANRGRERIKVDGAAVHLNQKPEALIERTILASSEPGDVVWDPFCGTGTGAVVANRLKRVCFTCEMNPDYQAIARARFDALFFF